MTHKNVSWLARSRRSLLLSGCFALLATTAAVAQSTQPLELEIDHNGTGWSDEQTLPTADWEEPIKFRIKGNYAEWVRLVVDAWAQDEELIGEFPEMGIDYYEVANNPIFPWQADPNSPKVGVLPARMVFAVDIGLRNLNTFAPDGQALRDWYVPLRQTGMWREWKYDSELWVNNPQHGTGFGAMNRTWWEANSKAATGVGATSSEFSAEALFRWAVLLRMAATYESHGVDPLVRANAYFDHEIFADAVHHFVVQGVALRKNPPEAVPPQPPTHDIDIPIFLPPQIPTPSFPTCRITTKRAYPIIVHKNGILRSKVQGLTGTLIPGTTHYFRAEGVHRDIRYTFPTTTGKVQVAARSAILRHDPLRYSIQIPSNLVTGDIQISDVKNPKVKKTVGTVDSVN